MALDRDRLLEGVRDYRRAAQAHQNDPDAAIATSDRTRARLVRHLAAAHPVYARLWKGIDLDDWACLPILTKDDLVHLQDALIVQAGHDPDAVRRYLDSPFALDASLDDDTLAYHSSGSSGRRTIMLKSARDVGRMVAAFLHGPLAQAGQTGARIAYAGLINRFNGGNQWAHAIGHFVPLRMFDLFAPCDSYADALAAFRPTILVSRPGNVLAMVDAMAGVGAPVEGLICIGVGETTSAHVRQTLFKRHGLSIRTSYATSEIGPVGFQYRTDVPALSPYRALVCVELVDEAGRLITKPGIDGTIVVSTLMTEKMPLIRYATGDIASWHKDGNPGDISLVDGRSLTSLRLRYGGDIAQINERHLSRLSIRDVGDYRIVQTSGNALRIDYVCLDGATPDADAAAASLSAALERAGCTLPVRIEARRCPDLPRDPVSGKIVRVVPLPDTTAGT